MRRLLAAPGHKDGESHMKIAMLFAFAAVLGFAPVAGAQDANHADVMRASDAFDNAQRTQNRAALERVIAPDYVLVHGSGRIGGRIARTIARFCSRKITFGTCRVGMRRNILMKTSRKPSQCG